MSDVVPSDLDYLDDRTHIIVYRFIQNAQKLLSQSYIPSEIKLITLRYVDDHFMIYRGSHKWIINDIESMQQILSSQPTQLFTSDIFEICKLKWTLKLYPNGNTLPKSNHVLLHIHLLSMPPTWTSLLVRITVECKELNTKCVMIEPFTANYNAFTHYSRHRANHSWPEDTLSFNELININPSKLTFTIKIKILQIRGTPSKYKLNTPLDMVAHIHRVSKSVKYRSEIMNYQKYYKFKWIIKPKQISVHRTHWLPRKTIYSDIFGDLFNLYYTPSTSAATLQICGLPNSTISALNVKWTLIIPEADIKYSNTSKLSLLMKEYSHNPMNRNQTNNSSDLLLPTLTFVKFHNYETLTFLLSVEILNEFNDKGNIIGMDVDVEDEWNKYYIQKKNSKSSLKLSSNLESNVGSSDAKKVKEWLRGTVELEQYYDLLVTNGFDNMKAIKSLKSKQLKNMGVALRGHRQQILMFVEKLNKKKNRNKLVTDEVVGGEVIDDEIVEERNEVNVWLCEQLKMEEVWKLFKKEGIDDMEIVKSLSYQMLSDIGVERVGDRIKILNAIEKLKRKELWERGFVIVFVCVLCVMIGCYGSDIINMLKTHIML